VGEFDHVEEGGDFGRGVGGGWREWCGHGYCGTSGGQRWLCNCGKN
jgi:hypothetical protein